MAALLVWKVMINHKRGNQTQFYILLGLLMVLGSCQASTGIILEIGRNDPGQCKTEGMTLDYYPGSTELRFLLSGRTLSKSMVTGNSASVGCLPRVVPFMKEFNYADTAGVNATLRQELILNHVFNWGS